MKNRIISYIGFGISATFTSFLMLTTAISLAEKVLFIGMALLMQLGSFEFMKMYKGNSNRLYGALSCMLFLISIFSSFCLSVNQLNILKNEEMFASEEYKNAKEAKKLTEENRSMNIDLLKEKKKEKGLLETQLSDRVNSAKATYASNIEMLTQQKNALEQDAVTQVKNAEQKITQRINKLPSDYLTQRKNEQAEGAKEVEKLKGKNNKKIDEIATKIIKEQNKMMGEVEKITSENITLLDGKSKELDEVSSKASKIENVAVDKNIAVETKSEKGFLGFISLIEKGNLQVRDFLVLVISLILAVCFELTAIGFYLADEKKKPINEKDITPIPTLRTRPTTIKLRTRETIKPEPIEIKPEPITVVEGKPEPIEAVKPKIGFTVKKQETEKKQNNAEAQKYINSMFETSEKGICKGYRTIAKHAEMKKDGRTYFEALKSNGAIEIVDGQAKIIKDKGDIIL